MSQAPSMPLFCDAYLADTMHLSLEEHGAYMKILIVTWRNNGQPLPDDDARMARILGVTVGRWKTKIRPAVEGFFDLSGGTWRQKRLEKEWHFVKERAGNSRRNGMGGGRPKSLNNNETGNLAGFLQVTQNEPTQSQSQVPVADATEAAGPPSQAEHGQLTLLPIDPVESVASPAVDLKSEIFGVCLGWLVKSTGKTADKLRPAIGRLCSRYGDGATLEVLQNAARAGPVDPLSWIHEVIQRDYEDRNGTGNYTRKRAGSSGHNALFAAGAQLDATLG